ncbi:MAG: tetratricopeptide repeat protein [Bacteroidetes bacterium]|nr:tetratricopeptide repeat protein [Bacteroidota bacterium]
MKYFLKILFLFFFAAKMFASEPKIILDSAGMAYSKGNFQKAAEQYEKIISMGYESPEIYFNLGNAYYKLDNLGKSILNYEKAKKLSPQDEDIAFNLKLANQRTVDKIEPAPKLFLDDWWDSLKSSHSEKSWSMRSIGCFVLFLFFLGIFIISGKSINKQFGFWLSLTFFVLFVLTFTIARGRHHDIVMHDSAVILSSSAEIKNAPAESGTKLFILHEGAKVSFSETNGDWIRVELSSDKVGWVKKSQLEFI